MRVVLLTSKPPYPIVDGGCFATARLLDDLLELNVDLLHVSLTTPKHPGDKSAYPRELSEIHFFETNTTESALGFLRSALKGSSYNIDRFRNEAVNAFLRKTITEEDVLIVDSLFASTVMASGISSRKTILRSHNVEFKIWEDFAADKKNSWLKRQLFSFLSKRLKKYELSCLKKVDEVWTISTEDHSTFKNLGIQNCTHLPVRIESNITERNYEGNEAFFLGSYSWGPNQEAIDYLTALYASNTMESKLHLIGTIDKEISSESVVQHGFVQDLDGLLSQLGFLAAPIFSGSGVKIKILESMQAGIPVLTTALGAHGIEDKEAICIADTTTEFERSLKDLIADQALREHYGKLARQYIHEFHSPKRSQRIILASISSGKV